MDFSCREEIIEFSEKFVDFLNSHKSKKAKFKEDISSNNKNYNRHFTSMNRFSFIIESAGFRISGGRIMIFGEDDGQYDIDILRMISGEIEGNIVTIIETMDGKYTRRSEITIL